MAATQAETLVTPARIFRRVSVPDDFGGQVVTETTTDTLCRVAPTANQPAYTVFAAKAAEQLLYRITFPAGTVIGETDRIEALGRTFEVLGVLAPATYETARPVLAMEVD